MASRSCVGVAAVTVTGEVYDFELKSQEGLGAGWVGVGLSDDDKMGDDSVIECSRGNGGGVQAYMTYNYPGYRVERVRNVSIRI